MDRAQNGLLIDHRGRIDGPGDTEIGHLHLASFGEKDIVGLDITMDDAIGMGFFQSISDIDGNAYGRINRNIRMGLDVLLQGLPFHIFHDNIMDIPIASYVVNSYDIRMGQLTC